MSNRYDAIEAQQPQTPQQNRYDQIEAGTHPTQRSYSVPEAIVGAAQHAYPSAANFAQNVAAALLHPINTAETAGDLIGGIPLAFLDKLSQVTGNGSIKDKIGPDEQQDLKTATAMADALTNRYGGWDAIKRTFAEDPVGFAADATSILQGGAGVARLAAAGTPSLTAQAALRAAAPLAEGAASAINPIANAGRVTRAAMNKLGLNGGPAATRIADALLPAPFTAGRVLPSFESAAQNALVSDLTEGNGGAVQNALRGVGTPLERVPGSIPNAAQAVADDMNATRLAAAAKAAKGNLPTEAANLQDAQNAARLAAVRSVGQTPADLEAAIQAREAGAAADYAISHSVMSKVDPELRALMERPSMQAALGRAQEIAADRGKTIQNPTEMGNNVSAPSRPFAGDLNDLLGIPNQRITGVNATLGMPGNIINEIVEGSLRKGIPGNYTANYFGPSQEISGLDLHTIKQAMDDLAYDTKVQSRFGIGAAQADAIRGVRGELINWIEKNNPAYATARQNYATASQPINRMQIGQYLESKLTSPLMGEDAPIQRADSFAAALDNAANEALGNSSIRKATAQQRYQHLRDILTPAQMDALQGVSQDLSRAKMAEVQARMASQYSGDLNNAASRTWGSMLPPVAQPVVNYLMQNMDRRIAGNVGGATMTPQAMNALVTNTLARQNALRQLGRGANLAYQHTLGRLNRYSAIYNALQQQNGGKK